MVEHSDPIPVPTPHSPETIRIRRALKSLPLYMAEREFCEGSSARSGEIAKNMAELVEPCVLDMDFDSLVKISVFASFQNMELSENNPKRELSDLKAALFNVTGDLDVEKVAHAETLSEFERTRVELQVAKDSLKSLDEEMTKLLDKMAIQEKESKDVAVQYSLMARIGMLLEPPEVKASWDVKDEIKAFNLRFPESDLEDWGVSEVEDNPASVWFCPSAKGTSVVEQ